ncbi:GGDEF domain-containing protein [Marinococcus luteus]|uniref:GGDEF domain-containing protein n=1 Tax=Marinococcus luteus TaxID=1122204 RepID=UPI002ACD12A1|nr:diguanylate cyclase [Marinococcus luteus]MDZ5782583.1 diguanylate cyclase [Marinococcus luteus]
MFSQLFVNLTILVTFLFFYYQVFREHSFSRVTTIPMRLFTGVLFGVLGMVLIGFGIRVNEYTLIDLRHIPIMLSALFGGWIPAVAAAVIISFSRIALGGGAIVLYPLSMIIFSTMVSIFIARMVRNPWLAAFYMLLCSNIYFLLIMMYQLNTVKLYTEVTLSYWFVSFAGAFAAVYMVKRLTYSNQLLHKYRSESLKDPLTGLDNPRSFAYSLTKNLEQASKMKQSVSLLIIDIDHFKDINDRYGHAAGDDILRQLGTVLLEMVRPEDSVYRKGGEEFTIILSNCPASKAVDIAERIRERVEKYPFLTDHQTLYITVSTGVSIFPETAVEERELFKQADDALYQAKDQGRNQTCMYSKKDLIK